MEKATSTQNNEVTSEHPSERMENYEKRKDAGDSCEGAEIVLKETPKKNRPISEDADAPQECDICQRNEFGIS